MIDITHKIKSLRKAVAQAIVKVGSQETIEAIQQNKVPKGDVLEAAKIAGLFAVKRTSDVIPVCHPVPVEFTALRFNIEGNEIKIECEVHAIYRTGMEVEAMHGATIAALTMYDMLKPIDKNIEIHSIKLLHKSGGKSDFKSNYNNEIKAAVIVCSDSVSAGKAEDSSGKLIQAKLQEYNIECADYIVIKDDKEEIKKAVLKFNLRHNNLIVLTGGTGVSPRDVTPETVKEILDFEIPGIAEAARNYGLERTPFSMLSRSVSGIFNNSLIITLPGAEKAVAESMDALFPYVFHVFSVLKMERH